MKYLKLLFIILISIIILPGLRIEAQTNTSAGTGITNISSVVAGNAVASNSSAIITNIQPFYGFTVSNGSYIQSGAPSQTYFFKYIITNKANTIDNGVKIGLVSFVTSAAYSTGTWIADLYSASNLASDIGEISPGIDSFYASDGSVTACTAFIAGLNEEQAYPVYLGITVGNNPQPLSWGYVGLTIITTNNPVNSYTGDNGITYGGLGTVSVVTAGYVHIEAPDIRIVKSIESISNIISSSTEAIPNADIKYKIWYSNMGSVANFLEIRDIFPKTNVGLVVGSVILASNHAPGNFNIEYTYNDGVSWVPGPVPGVVNTTVDGVRFRLSGTPISNSTSGVIYLKLRITVE